jgi:hypothetical protein
MCKNMPTLRSQLGKTVFPAFYSQFLGLVYLAAAESVKKRKTILTEAGNMNWPKTRLWGITGA